jgi:hypothetical protein
MLMDLLDELDRLRISLQCHGDRLRFRPRDAVTPELREQLRSHKAKLLEIFRPRAAAASKYSDWIERPGPDGYATLLAPEMDATETIDTPDPCLRCGGIVMWWDWGGGQHCEKCEPRTKATQLRELAQQLRDRYAKLQRETSKPD